MIRQTIAVAIAASLATSASAQSLRSFELDGQRDTRAMVGISIPFGGAGRDRADLQPRFDLRVQSDRYEYHGFDPAFGESRRVGEGRLSFTLEEQPRFLLNGEALLPEQRLHAAQDGDAGQDAEEEGDDDGRSTVQKIGRGAAFVGAGFGAFLLVGLGVLVVSGGPSSNEG